jgi:hypothetical protein
MKGPPGVPSGTRVGPAIALQFRGALVSDQGSPCVGLAALDQNRAARSEQAPNATHVERGALRFPVRIAEG